MHNAYFSSTLVSFKSKGSLSFSFNDYSSLLNERFDRTSLSCCSCCCTCCSCCEVSAAHNHRVPLNTSYLYGLRQSTLIQRPPYKRLIFRFKDRIFSRLPVYDLDRGSYEVSCSIRERTGDEGFGGRRKRRFRRMASEETSERSWLGGVDDAEAVISLLSEEVDEECLGRRERSGRLAKRVEIVKNEVHGGELYRRRKKKVEVEKRGNCGGEFFRGRKKNVGSNLLESNPKCECELPRIEVREEGYRSCEGKEAIARGNKHRERTKSSSCSSYYPILSDGEYEEVQDKKVRIAEESVSGFRKDSSRSEEDSYKAKVAEQFNKVDGHEAAEQRSSAAGSRVEWDCRKKSEKKLTEVVAQETKSTKQSSDIHWRIHGATKTDYEEASTSHQQLDNVEEESALAVNWEKGTRKLYSQMDVQDTKQSRRKWQEAKIVEEMHGTNVETTSESQKQLSGREENVTRGKLCHTGLIAGNNDLKRDLQQPTRTSEFLNADSERVSDLRRHLGSRLKVQQKDETLVQSSIQQTKEQRQQSSERISGQIDLRSEPEYFSELSETHETNFKKSSTIQSETKMKNLEENSRLQHSQNDHELYQRTKSWKGSQDVSRVSLLQASEMERRTDSLGTSEKGVNQESAVTSVVKPMGTTRDRHNQPDEKATQSKLRKEAQKPTGVSSTYEEYSEESSSIQASLNLVSHARVQQINVEKDEEEERISQEILMPPPPQLLTVSLGHAACSSGFAVQNVSSESGSSALHTNAGMRTPSLRSDSYVKGGQDETYDEPLNLSTYDDALGSAHRFAESSAQLVGEFVEKARDEVSTSELRKENIAETEVLYGGEKQSKMNSGQYGSEDLHLKGHEPGKSSESSGAKGPSDEMWDVTGSFVQPEAEAMEGNQAAGNAIVKRRGRSLWNIMADIVRLRWGSHAETPSSATRSDAKSPSNDSVSSGTWFSGRESDKNGDENMKREGSSPSQDETPFHQLQQGRTTRGQGEKSDKIKSTSKEQKLEADMPSSSTVIEGGSTSKRISRLSSSSVEKNPDQKADRNSSQSASSGQEALLLSSQLPAETLRTPPAVEAVSETGKTYASESGSMDQLAQPFNSRLIEASGYGKDGELKLRKLQRNKQVLKDRFDEWEEAYKLESEQRKIDEMFMREALLEAKKAADTWEVPVGAVLVQHGKIIARGCNLVEELRDSTAHAEMICIRAASNVLRTWRLSDATLYVTLEPCPMCAGAILQARVSTVVWGAPNKLLGADGSWVRIFPDGGEKRDGLEPSDKPAAPVHPFHPKMTIRRGVLAAECVDIMQQFFQLRRRKKEKIADDLPPPSCVPIVNQQSKILTKMRHMFHMMFCL